MQMKSYRLHVSINDYRKLKKDYEELKEEAKREKRNYQKNKSRQKIKYEKRIDELEERNKELDRILNETMKSKHEFSKENNRLVIANRNLADKWDEKQEEFEWLDRECTELREENEALKKKIEQKNKQATEHSTVDIRRWSLREDGNMVECDNGEYLLFRDHDEDVYSRTLKLRNENSSLNRNLKIVRKESRELTEENEKLLSRNDELEREIEAELEQKYDSSVNVGAGYAIAINDEIERERDEWSNVATKRCDAIESRIDDVDEGLGECICESNKRIAELERRLSVIGRAFDEDGYLIEN